MKSEKIKVIASLLFALVAMNSSHAQNVAINANGTAANLSSILDLDGVTGFIGPNGYKGLLIPRMTSAQRIGIVTLPAAAQGLVVYQTDGVQGFYYNTSTTTTPAWLYLLPSGTDWLLTGNAGTTASAAAIGSAATNNFIGTTDAIDFVIASNNLERMRVSSAGSIGINTSVPVSSAWLTINPTNNIIKSGIDMTLAGATSGTATGLNISTGNSFVNGITVVHSSASTTSSLYGIGATLSSTNIVAGYNAYRNGSGLSYGIYGINGTNAAYATNASTWAAFLQGRTVVSGESSPTSPVGTDLEVRNTTAGAASPATVSLRQTTSLPNSGDVLTNLNFGDNNQTGPQAQIKALRPYASGSAADIPTAISFSTTLDGTNTLAERMRITETNPAGGYGLSMGATVLIDHNSAVTSSPVILQVHDAGTTAGDFGQLNLSTSNITIARRSGAVNFAATQTGGAERRTAAIESYLTALAGTNGSGNLIFLTTNAGAFAERMRIDETGNVGIANILPTQKLDVTGNVRFSGALMPNNIAGTAGQVLTSQGAGVAPQWLPVGAGSYWLLTGNPGTSATTNFIGTTDLIPFSMKVNNVYSGRIDITTVRNTSFGYNAGNIAGVTTEIDNTAVGDNALAGNVLTTQNVAVGSGALGSQNVPPVGGQWNTENTAVGYYAMHANKPSDNFTDGFWNTGVGSNALASNTRGFYNTAVGRAALQLNVLGNNNTAVGTDALNGGNVNTVNNNTAVGTYTMISDMAPDNTAVGFYSLRNSAFGSQNVAIGSQALFTQTSAGAGAVFASNDVAVGFKALYNTDGLASTVNGINNTALGYNAGFNNTTGSSNTFIGSNANGSAGGLTNATAIGAGASVSSSNAVVLGNAASVLIGTSTAVVNAKLSVKDGHIQTSQTTAPTILVNANAGTAGAAVLLAGSNDIAGQITLTEGTAAWASAVQCTITFNRPYTTAPFVVLTPVNAAAASGASTSQVFVTSTTTTFVINFGVAAGSNNNWKWNYIVIEP